jgi:hypothetical protein
MKTIETVADLIKKLQEMDQSSEPIVEFDGRVYNICTVEAEVHDGHPVTALDIGF